MIKKAFIIALSLLLVVLSSGCSGGSTAPTLRESVASLDAAVVKYDSIMGLYSSGNYTGAREEYIAIAETFHDCQSALETAARGDATPLEKKIAGNLAGCSGQFAYASQYMRDACTEALKHSENEYLVKITADEYALTARNTYEANRRDLSLHWKNH